MLCEKGPLPSAINHLRFSGWLHFTLKTYIILSLFLDFFIMVKTFCTVVKYIMHKVNEVNTGLTKACFWTRSCLCDTAYMTFTLCNPPCSDLGFRRLILFLFCCYESISLWNLADEIQTFVTFEHTTSIGEVTFISSF